MDQRIVQRKDYLKHLTEWEDDTRAVKIIMGARRCGKSTLMKQFLQHLEDEGKENIVYIDLESMEYDDVRDHKALNGLLKKKIGTSGRAYVLIDEVQIAEGWELSINSLTVDYDADVYITGSNGYMLSSELSTYLSGRYVEIRMLPLSFGEYLELHPPEGGASIDDRFADFLLKGAMPAIDPADGTKAYDMLQGLYSTIIRKDVSRRIRSVDLRTMDGIVSFMMSNVGSVTSAGSIGAEIGASANTVKKYIQGLEDAFLFYHAHRFDVRGKRYLKTAEKYYSVDTGLRNAVLGGSSGRDMGHILENAVFIELVRRGYEVMSGRYYDKEFDFVARKGETVEYYQVALSILDENTYDREIRPLSAVRDSFPKTVLTTDKVFSTPGNGIMVKNVRDWMLEGRRRGRLPFRCLAYAQ